MKSVAKIAFLIFVWLVSLIGFEILASKIISTVEYNKYLTIPDETIEFYKTHITDLHHLRELNDGRWKISENPHDAIFSTIAPFRKNQSNILIQGDSWAQQFNSATSKKALAQFADERQVGIINAGVSSYAPSVMTVQLRKLRQQFQIHPTNIVAIIDQTDIGDELCRYAVRRNFDASNRLISVQPKPFGSTEMFSWGVFFRKQAIFRSDKFALQKLTEITALKIRQYLSKEKMRCDWPEISRPLVQGISKEEEEDFIRAVRGYIDEVFSDNQVKSLHIIVHPHRNHLPQYLQSRYVLYAGELVKSAVQSNKHGNNIILLDFLNQEIGSYLNNPGQELFTEGDRGSHLKSEIHGTELTPRILAELRKQL